MITTSRSIPDTGYFRFRDIIGSVIFVLGLVSLFFDTIANLFIRPLGMAPRKNTFTSGRSVSVQQLICASEYRTLSCSFDRKAKECH
jgi:hypothetical protein